MITDFMDMLPLWGIFIASLAITYTSINLGIHLGQRKRERLNPDEKAHLGPILTATLSMLAFMVAIVFNNIQSRHQERKYTALDEANAIGVAFLRADLLPENDRAYIQNLLDEYVALHLETTYVGTTQDLDKAIERAEALQNMMWQKAVSFSIEQPTPISALFVQALNQVINLNKKKITLALHYRMPGKIWLMLYSLAIITMISGGYDSGLSGSRRVFVITLLSSFAFSLVLTLMVSIDRPWEQLSVATHEVMVGVQEDIHRLMKSKY